MLPGIALSLIGSSLRLPTVRWLTIRLAFRYSATLAGDAAFAVCS